MPLWPFIPQQGVVETLEWLTDINRCKSAEQRFAQRLVPRQGFQFRHILTPLQYSRMKSFSRFYGAQEFDLPLWWELTEIGALGIGEDELTFDTLYAHFAVGGRIVVWESDDLWEVVEVATLDGSGLTFTPPLTKNFASAVVAPVKAVRFGSPPDGKRGPHDYVNVGSSFISTEGEDLTDAGAYPTYLGHQVMTDRSFVLSGIDERFQREFELVDGETGIVHGDPLFTYPVEGSILSWDTLTRAGLWAVRQWLYSRRGKQKGFWLPTWNNDLQITANIVSASDEITIQPIGYPTQEGIRDIMIRSIAGVNTYKRVESGIAVGATEVLTLSAVAGVDLTPAQVEVISFLNFMRLDADRIEVKHRTASGASIAVAVMEAPVP